MNPNINVERAKEYALYNFYNGLSCTESVYDALLRAGAIDAPQETCAICAGFGGGIGLSGYTCGALSGAVMAIGVRHGRKDPHNDITDGLYNLEYLRFNNVAREFVEANGSALCGEIVRDYANNAELWGHPDRKAHCTKVVLSAVELACKYLAMEQDEVTALSWGTNVAGK